MKSLLIATALLFAIPAFADISANSTFMSFGSEKVGSYGYSYRNVVIRNNSDKPVNVMFQGYCEPNFSVRNNCYQLGRYGSCDVSASFRPTREGYHSCNVSVRDSTGSTVYITLTGFGTKN